MRILIAHPQSCPHDILVPLTDDLNRCERCGSTVTTEELHRQTMRAMRYAWLGPGRRFITRRDPA